jgi:hypothetical protein
MYYSSTMSDGKNSLRSQNGAVGGDAPDALHVDASGVVPKGESEQALLLAGKISVEEYMDMTVDRTLSHLRGQISGQRFSLMREVLRQELEQDPHLSALVARVAAGH